MKMIEPSMLTAEEVSWIGCSTCSIFDNSSPQITWLNNYHAECLDKVGSYLADTGKAEVLKWLERETQALG